MKVASCQLRVVTYRTFAPLLDSYLDAGFDVLVGVDPEQGTHTDMARVTETLAGGAVARLSGALVKHPSVQDG